MSVVPGLGHIYKGHRLVGAILMAGTLLVSFFVAATVSATAGVALVLVPIYWSIVMLHAFWAEDVSSLRQSACLRLRIDGARTIRRLISGRASARVPSFRAPLFARNKKHAPSGRLA